MNINTATLNTEDDYMEVQAFCKAYDYASSTVHPYIRKGDIALHQFMGEARPKINVAEALRVMANVKRRYSLSTMRIVRHDEAVPQKANLFN
jgi:phage terminase small subunit